MKIEPISVKVPVAAKMLGVSDIRTIYSWIDKGLLKAAKVGRIYLVNVKSIHALALDEDSEETENEDEDDNDSES